MTRRLDAELVARGLARSRARARALVDGGRVRIDGRPVSKPAAPVGTAAAIEVIDPGPDWVGRGALKLAPALAAFGLDVRGRRCVDVGASTGGFTQVLLHEGAAQVVALDVGHGQLARSLAGDPRVVDRSGLSVRDLAPGEVGGPFDVLVADLSFIPTSLVMADLRRLVTPDGDALLLVKPQFEVGRRRLGKNGVVRSAADRAWAIRTVARAAAEVGWRTHGAMRSPVVGATGNIEYLLWLAARDDGALGWEAVVGRADALSVEGTP